MDYKRNGEQNFDLELFLDTSVSLRIFELKQKGGPTEDDFRRVQTYNLLLGEQGNFLWTKSKKKGQTAKVANAVADSIAVLSFAPGGVEIFGRHWKSDINFMDIIILYLNPKNGKTQTFRQRLKNQYKGRLHESTIEDYRIKQMV